MIGVADGASRAQCVTQHDSRGLAAAENTEGSLIPRLSRGAERGPLSGVALPLLWRDHIREPVGATTFVRPESSKHGCQL